MVKLIWYGLEAREDKEERKREIAPALEEDHREKSQGDTKTDTHDIKVKPSLGEEGDRLDKEAMVHCEPVEDAQLGIQDKAPGKGDCHYRGDIGGDKKPPQKGAAAKLPMDQQGRRQTQKNRQDTSPDGIDQCGQKGCIKIRV